MAAEVQPLAQITAPAGPSTSTPDQIYWRSFRSQLLLPSPQSAGITSITHPSTPSDLFTVTTGTRILLLSTRTRRITKTISRLSHADTAYSGTLRGDSRIVLSGSATGLVQAYDASSRAILKTWRAHSPQPVWSVTWNPTSLTHAMSTSDDRTVRTWDLPSDEPVATFTGHTDYVRSGCYVPRTGGSIIASGSYDRTVRLWDSRSPGTRHALAFDVGDPVEALLPFADGNTLACAAGPRVTVLDLTAARARAVLRNHQKTVTCLALAGGGTRLISGGLDGHVKVFSTAGVSTTTSSTSQEEDLPLVAGFKYPAPVLSAAVIPSADGSDRHLAVGLSTGLLSLRTRLPGAQRAVAREKEREMTALAAGTIEAYDRAKAKREKKRKLRQGDRAAMRGRDFTGEGADIVIDGAARGRVRNASKWESALRKGNWRGAMELVLRGPGGQPDKQAMLTLLAALGQRSATRAAISGLERADVIALVRWVTKNVNDPRYVRSCVALGLVLVDEYAGAMGGDEPGDVNGVDAAVGGLVRRVRHAVEMAKTAGLADGMLEFVAAEHEGDRGGG